MYIPSHTHTYITHTYTYAHTLNTQSSYNECKITFNNIFVLGSCTLCKHLSKTGQVKMGKKKREREREREMTR